MNVMDQIKATQDRNRQELEALADLTGQTVKQVEADLTALDYSDDTHTLPCGCISGQRHCHKAAALWQELQEAHESYKRNPEAARRWEQAQDAYGRHFEQEAA